MKSADQTLTTNSALTFAHHRLAIAITLALTAGFACTSATVDPPTDNDSPLAMETPSNATSTTPATMASNVPGAPTHNTPVPAAANNQGESSVEPTPSHNDSTPNDPSPAPTEGTPVPMDRDRRTFGRSG